MHSFKKLNNIVGWIVFLIATTVYLLTVERTASFWDCGEFIAASYKLMVPHPPGAPFFLLVGRMFSLLAGDVTQVAYWINLVSVLSSSFTILFLFWTITLLGIKVLKTTIKDISQNHTYLLMAAGAVGALAYTFSDSFWFSAVEAEVYAMSSFFTAFIFWAILKWELVEDESQANKWILLIAYMVGLSIGVHLLNLVAIPALALVYYYKKYPKTSIQGGIAALGIGGVLILLIMMGVIPGLPTWAGNFEVFFVNSLGLPFGIGLIVFVVLLLAAVVYGIIYSIQKEKLMLNTAMLSLSFILIGYASYGIILIRSEYNPPIDENDPENIVSFVSYLKREQYGDRPLFFGPKFTSELVDQKQGAPLYRKNDAKKNYEIYDHKVDNIYEDNMLLPRVYSRSMNHPELYRNILNLNEGEKPSMGDNIYFLFKHQLGHMYWRYFLWNFAGRESDVQDAGWLSPFEAKSKFPEEIATNKAHNQYYMLPFLLGLIGLIFHSVRDQKSFLVVCLLFFLTGIALVLYLNSPPSEPRERDYIYAGSFYAFAIWIGFGLISIYAFLEKYLKKFTPSFALATVLSLIVPTVMIAQGWDDHNRANRYYSVDSAKNLLNSCAKNAILFTAGDNDTFPLWYVQEVEGFRTDVRVCNLSLLATDWYISQMKRPAYESKPLPLSLELDQYMQGKNDQIVFMPNAKLPELEAKRLVEAGVDLPTYIKLVKDNNPIIQYNYGENAVVTTIPSQKINLNIDKEKVIKMGIVPKDKEALIQDKMTWTMPASQFFKNDLMMLDMIVTNQWERPIYFSNTLSSSNYLNLKEYMQVEGLAYRLLPVKVEGATQGYINSDLMYENMMKKMFWRELDNPKVYYDENYYRFTINARSSFARLATQLYNENKKDQAKEVALYCLKIMPDKSIAYDVYTPQLLPVLLKVGEDKVAYQICEVMAKRADENLNYYLAQERLDEMSIQTNLIILSQITASLKEEKREEQAAKYEKILQKHYQKLQ